MKKAHKRKYDELLERKKHLKAYKEIKEMNLKTEEPKNENETLSEATLRRKELELRLATLQE